MSKYLSLNIENAGLLSNIEIGKYMIKFDYVFKTIDNPIPSHLLLNILTTLIGEIPIPEHQKYGYTNTLEGKQKGRNILENVIRDAYVYYHINDMNLFDFLDKEVITKSYIGVKKGGNSENVKIYGISQDDVKNQISVLQDNSKDYDIKQFHPWYKAPWEFISGEKTAIDSNVKNSELLFDDGFKMEAQGFYSWAIFEKNYNLTSTDKNNYNKIIKHIQKILNIDIHPKLIYPKYKDLCHVLYEVIMNDEEVYKETLSFCQNCKINTLNNNIYLYTLFGYKAKCENLYNGSNSTSNVVQQLQRLIRHTAVINTVDTQAILHFDGNIIIPLHNLSEEDETYIIDQIKNNSGITNCLEGGIATIEILEQISFNMDDYIQIFQQENSVNM